MLGSLLFMPLRYCQSLIPPIGYRYRYLSTDPQYAVYRNGDESCIPPNCDAPGTEIYLEMVIAVSMVGCHRAAF